MMESDTIRGIVKKLENPIADVETLLSLLCGPLDSLGLLQAQFRRYNIQPIETKLLLAKHIPLFQRVILEHVALSWQSSLARIKADSLLDQFFCPHSTLPNACQVVLLAYSTILSVPLTQYSVHLLHRMTEEFPVDRMYIAVFRSGDHQQLTWDDYVHNISAVPAKVSNIFGPSGDIPPTLEHATYFNCIATRFERLVRTLTTESFKDWTTPIVFLLSKFVNLGLFPASLPTSPGQPSFFQAILSEIREKLVQHETSYFHVWSELFTGFSSLSTLKSILTSLFVSLASTSHLEASPVHRNQVKSEASLLTHLVGNLSQDRREIWDATLSVIISRDWHEGHGRIFVCWLANSVKYQVLQVFLEEVMTLWASPEHIRHSLLARHQYITCLLLLTVSYFPPNSEYIKSLSLSSTLLSGVGSYIGHLDSSVRRCGMLVAEVVAQLSGKKLNFGDWDGNDPARNWARSMRRLIAHRDADETEESLTPILIPESPSMEEQVTTGMQDNYDSDDSLRGYSSLPSSRSNSPTPSELDEIEKDPSLGIGLKPVARPVYLAQLGQMLRGPTGSQQSDGAHEARKIEIALDCGEELIRKKKNYGTELDENAVNIAYGLAGLNNTYDLGDFDIKRQNALWALVACCPKRAAPCIIEEFFKNQYSTDQRYVMLNALALGARELAQLPLPAVSRVVSPFPGKLLPAHLRRVYTGETEDQPISSLLDDIRRESAAKENKNGSQRSTVVRERRLRLAPHRVTNNPSQFSSPATTFNDVAAEFFLCPLINRFWLFLRDEQTREERTSHLQGRQQYRGTGTGLILNPIILTHFLRALAILAHASRNALEWISVIAPNVLEIAVTMGTKPVSLNEVTESYLHGNQGKEASVLTAALELALVVLDGCIELDDGRLLCLEHTALLLGIGEWAGKVFSQLEAGQKVGGAGGTEEVKLQRVVVGVLLRIDEMTSKWQRSIMHTWET